MPVSAYSVYILLCGDRTLYTGITTDLARRFKEHRAGRGGHYTSARKAVKILYSERAKTRSRALKREIEIKGWDRRKKLDLIRTSSSQRRQ